MPKSNTWKLQDAKAQFSEVVRRARSGEPQHVTVHGKDAVVIVDSGRFEVHPKRKPTLTMAEFIEASKKYRGVAEGVEFEQRFPMVIKARRSPFDDDNEK
jgi:prevent-host-death family protein